ncbi:hypothetical protein [Alkalilimnicola sp. S0819]|uniref:hypothetical protein n=1 Tax=Alkalilimnicola sp. S0819 TaxID=2613922 RepID=UPI001261F5AF|nr:hypothetical protein [Alkalilimnicola sp. S0819]KAB7624347.1 hypothetical protein F3N43_05945 [Alkalilimnicola sp. S0819]MPQ16173.1 hypothetical protein [Alkalilimnicola sp. S0819]
MTHNEITPDRVLAALSRHVGEGCGIHAKALATAVTGQNPPTPGQERQVRHAITALRLAGHHVCAHPRSGYFIAATEQELLRTCEFLHERAMASLRQIARMRHIALPDLRGQLKLPT